MAERVFEITQFIPKTPDELFPFFSDAKNLERITPPWLNFKIRSQSTGAIQKGSLFEYSLKIHGVPVFWRTLIESWDEPRMFVDTQLKGPYTLWHHTHLFEPAEGGTKMIDRVRYIVPLGPIGDLLAILWVSKDVQKIFEYRKKMIAEIFSCPIIS